MLTLQIPVASGLILLGGLVWTPAVTAEPIPQAYLRIRTSNLFGVPTRQLRAAQRTAQTIFQKAGVTLAGWRDCQIRFRASAEALDTCPEDLLPNEVVIRIVHTPPSGSNQWVLGFSYVTPHTTSSWLSTVFADHIAATANWFHLDPGTLLGRAVAHEVGHLLLASTSHSDNGLMRANWQGTSLARHVPADWWFSRSEAGQIRAEVIARSRASAEPLADLTPPANPTLTPPMQENASRRLHQLSVR